MSETNPYKDPLRPDTLIRAIDPEEYSGSAALTHADFGCVQFRPRE